MLTNWKASMYSYKNLGACEVCMPVISKVVIFYAGWPPFLEAYVMLIVLSSFTKVFVSVVFSIFYRATLC